MKMNLNRDFPRILALLRKEQGLSQRQAAQDLEIPQALLSHYEKGIREPGLEFVVRAAAYYGVSCDYLLGCTPHRSGAVISVQELPGKPVGRPRKHHSLAEYYQRVLTGSLHIVFALLKKINNESLIKELSTFLFDTVYRAFRLLYSANPQNPQGLFALDKALYTASVEAGSVLSMAKSRCLLTGEPVNGHKGVPKEDLPVLAPRSLEEEYPQYAPALFDLIRQTERSMQPEHGGLYAARSQQPGISYGPEASIRKAVDQ